MFHKTIIAFTTAVALGCVPVATSALAAENHSGGPGGAHATGARATGGHAMGGQHAMGGHATRGQAIGHYARGGQGTRAGGDYYQGGAPIYDYYQGGGDYYQDGAPTYEYQGGGGPSCDTYYGNGCPGYGVPFVGGLINGVLGGYDPY